MKTARTTTVSTARTWMKVDANQSCLLAEVEQDLQGADADGEQADAPVVDASPTCGSRTAGRR